MSELEKSARRARRRLVLNRWLAALGWSLAGAAGLFAITVCIERSFALLRDADVSGLFYGWLVIGLAGAAVVASAGWSLFTRESLTLAAARLDEAAGFKERISSALYCVSSPDPFARAVVADAERVSRGISMKHHLPVRVPDSAPWAGGTAFLALLVFLLFPTLDLAGKQKGRVDEKRREDRVNRTVAVIKPAIEADLKKLAEKNPEIKKELGELEELKDARLQTPADVRQEMMKQVDKIGQKLEQKANNPELGKTNEFKQMMRQLTLDQKPNSPVGELSKALAKSDFNSAQEAIKAIQTQLSKEAKTSEEQEKAEQMKADLQKLSDKLGQIAQNDQKLREQMAKAGMNQEEMKEAMEKLAKGDMQGLKEQLAKKGMSQQQAEQLAQQMKKRSDAASAASKLAQSMAKTASGKMGQKQSQNQQAQAQAQGQQGQGQGQQQGNQSDSGMEGLTEASQQLSEMEATEQQLNELQASMAQLGAMKDKIGQGCSQCGGTGMMGDQACSACQGSGMKPGQGGVGPGMGNLGIGQGGIAGIEKTNFNTKAQQAKVNTLPGAIISTQYIDGEQYKGEVSKEFVETVMSARHNVAEAIDSQKIPRPYQKSVGKYFDHAQADIPVPADKK